MRLHRWVRGRVGKGIALALGLAFSGASFAFAHEGSTSAKIEATIFSYDGHDFVRTQTTLLTKEGKSAVNTKLEHDTPAYKALSAKHSFTGEATVFGRKYDANYAPLTSEDGKLTGALFVAVAK
jgi:methyl-accepting chemotaxis protein